MVDVRAQEESMVQRLRLGEEEEVSDDHIQDRSSTKCSRGRIERKQVSQIAQGGSERDAERGFQWIHHCEDDDSKMNMKKMRRWADIVAELKSDPRKNLVTRKE